MSMIKCSRWWSWKITYLICLAFLIATVPTSPPSPVMFWDEQSIQMGIVRFNRANDAQPTPDYDQSYTITLTKMNKFQPNNFYSYFGWRGVDFYQTTQSQLYTQYTIFFSGSTATQATFGCHVSLQRFNFITGNYLLIHQALHTGQFLFGLNYDSISPPCGGTGVVTCRYPRTQNLPATGYKIFTAIKNLIMYNGNEFWNKNTLISFTIDPKASGFDIVVEFGQNGSLRQFSITLILVSDTLFDQTKKRRLMLDFFQNPNLKTLTTNSFVTVTMPLHYLVYDATYFVGISFIRNQGNQFIFNLYSNPSTFIITGEIFFAFSGVYFSGFAVIGFECAKGFYLNEITQTCVNCMDYSVKCVPNPYKQLQSLECETNFNISTDKFSCQCPWTVISGMCQDLTALNLTDCQNVEMNNTVFQCNFCSPILFKVIENNLCVCKTGYEDLDGDGVCLQTCGDGLIFQHQCDDNNTNSNDGCSPTCVKESGFVCDTNQPTYCQSETPLSYKISKIQKIETQNRGRITLKLMNDLIALPYDFTISEFRPSLTYVRLYLTLSESPLQEMEIKDVTLLDLTSKKEIVLEFGYEFTVQKFKARIQMKYDLTRYSHYTQDLRSTLNGISDPLIYTDKMTTYHGISIMLFVGTGLSLVGLLIGLLSPKYIGLESLLTLQLIFYSQLLISDPSKWPVGFLYLKYLKFASGYNDIFAFTDFVSLTNPAKKMMHLDMKKSIFQNFNISFIVLTLALLVFVVIFIVKYIKEKNMKQEEINENVIDQKIKEDELKKLETQQKIKSFMIVTWVTEKAFWILNHLSLWVFLPIMATVSAHILINNQLVQTIQSSLIQQISQKLAPFIVFSSISVIFFVSLNNFYNIFLCEETLRKITLKSQELTYKRLLFIYLLVVGSLVMFFNQIILFKIPMSILVLALQIIYTITLIAIHPYRQSLRVHTITLLINQCVYIVFLTFINLINMVEEMNETLVIMMGYFISGCCGFLMVLTAIRLYYELRYGEALEKQIQKEREKEEERQTKLKKEKLSRKKKEFEFEAKLKQSAQQIERGKNKYLYENQVKQDQANDLMQWLEKKNWQAGEKEKFFYEKFTKKPLEWLKKNEKVEYMNLMQMNQEDERRQKEKMIGKRSQGQLNKVVHKLRKECTRNLESWERQLAKHGKRIRNDMDYSMNVKREMGDQFIQKEYQLKQ